VLGTFLGAELGLQATINFEGKTRFGLFDRSARHSKSVVMEACRSGYGESGMAHKAVLGTVKSVNDSFDFQDFVDAQILSSEYASYGP
jgi:hypothetical protein